jgi:hypothetical protein
MRLGLRWLAVFCGAFPSTPRRRSGRSNRENISTPIDILDKLVERSLVSVDSRGGRVRLPLLESILHALQQLPGSNEAEC